MYVHRMENFAILAGGTIFQPVLSLSNRQTSWANVAGSGNGAGPKTRARHGPAGVGVILLFVDVNCCFRTYVSGRAIALEYITHAVECSNEI